MNSELKSTYELDVYEETDLPLGEKAIGCKWVFKVKRDANVQTKCKARLVVQGFGQGATDYDELFAPTLRNSSLYSALVIAAKEDYVIRHLDIKTAYCMHL